MKAEEIKLAFEKNIQFAISDDLKSVTDSLSGATSSINKSISDYEASFKSMNSVANSAKGVISNATKLISVAEGKAKELGVSPSSIPGYSEANKAWSIANSAVDKVNQF